MKRFNVRVLVSIGVLVWAALASPVSSQEQTIGVFLNEEGAFDGYTLFAANRYETTYLIDNEGRLVNSWDTGFITGPGSYLLEDGSMIRPAGQGGLVRRFSWEGDLVWEYRYRGANYVRHHDIEVLPNGNVLMITRIVRTVDEAVEAGRDPASLLEGELWSDYIVEIEPVGNNGGNVVWEWYPWDHLVQNFDQTKDNFGVVGAHPELINVNYVSPRRPVGEADWHHANGIDYNAELDQIMLTARHFGEVWIIDHSTSTEEAASSSGGNSGKGGDLLYRWGNPMAYGAGDAGNKQLFLQHDAQWIEPGLPGEGNILVFNNGQGRPGDDYSSVDEIVPSVDAAGNYAFEGGTFGPATPVWSYSDQPDFYSSYISGAVRLPNGNTLITSGEQGHMFEVTPEGDTVWSYINPVGNEGPMVQGEPVPILFGASGINIVFRSYRYAPDYPGLAGRDLTPGDPIEIILDTDGDGLPDDDELTRGTDPLRADTDGDGLSDGQEVDVYGTDPLNADTDGDGLLDGWEVDVYGTDPLNADTDGDGFDDGVEVDRGFDPANPSSSPLGDLNTDGNIDSIDAAIILQYTAGLLSDTPDPAIADVNHDGAITSVDAALILQRSAGLLG